MDRSVVVGVAAVDENVEKCSQSKVVGGFEFVGIVVASMCLNEEFFLVSAKGFHTQQ